MADLERMKTALINADKAGDIEAAKQLATAIKNYIPEEETIQPEIEPIQEQDTIQEEGQPLEDETQEVGFIDSAKSFIQENLTSPLAIVEAAKTAKGLMEGKDKIETAIDVKSKLDNIESRTSDITKTLKSFAGDEDSINDLKTKQNSLNNEVVSILDNKGIEAFNDNGTLMIVTKNEKGEEVLKPLSEETFDQILSDLGSAGGEIGGGIGGALGGASLANRALPPTAPLPLRGVATATGGLIGGYLGSATGRITDIVRNSLTLNREIDAKTMLEKGLETGALDVYAGAAGVGLGKIAGKIDDAVIGVKRYILDGNINGAKKILKSDYDLTDAQINVMFKDLKKDLSGLDDLSGAELVRAKITSAVQQTPHGKVVIAKAIESNPKAAIQLSKEIEQRAKFVEKAADSVSQNPSAIKKSLFAYQKLVKRNYGEVRKLIKEALPSQKYQLDKDAFKETLSDINTRIIDPKVKDKLENLTKVMAQKTSGNIDELIDLRQLFNKFYGKNKGHFDSAPDKKALLDIQKTLDGKIDEIINTLPSGISKGLKDAFSDAKAKYREMHKTEDNVAFKQIMKKGASDEEISKSLVKFSKANDETMEQVFNKLSPQKRVKAEFSILKQMIKKSSLKGEAKAIDFHKLLEDVGTSKKAFKSPEAKQFIRNMEDYEIKFGKDTELQRIALGIAPKMEKSIAVTLKGKVMQKISAIRFEAIQRLLPTDNAKRIALQEAIAKSLETSRTPKELLFKMSKNTSVPNKERILLRESIKRISKIENEIKKDLTKSKEK